MLFKLLNFQYGRIEAILQSSPRYSVELEEVSALDSLLAADESPHFVELVLWFLPA